MSSTGLNLSPNVLEAEAPDQIGAKRYERSESRQAYRNGHRPRRLTTRVGPVTLRVPQTRDGSFSTEIFHRYQRSEQALVLALMEMVVPGVSTRKVKTITEELCGTSFSRLNLRRMSTVSRLCRALDVRVNAWRERSLRDHRYPFVADSLSAYVDALVLKVRRQEAVRSTAALIALGVNEHGYREILGLQLGDSEREATWSAFFRSLKARGLDGVDLLVSDNHAGLVKAAERCFEGVQPMGHRLWQRCQTHLMRNVLAVTPKAERAALADSLRRLFRSESKAEARTVFTEIAADYEGRADRALEILEAGLDAATQVLLLPAYYRRRLRTTNMVERLNEEIRRRELSIRIFPNEASGVRLVGALLAEQHERWLSGKRYFDMSLYWSTKAESPSPSMPKTPIRNAA